MCSFAASLCQIFPLYIGEVVQGSFLKYFPPEAPDVSVRAVEERACHHLDEQALGSPLHPHRTIRNVLNTIGSFQGFPLEGEWEAALEKAAEKIEKMCKDMKEEREAAGTMLSPEELIVEERAKYERLLAAEKVKAEKAEQIVAEERAKAESLIAEERMKAEGLIAEERAKAEEAERIAAEERAKSERLIAEERSKAELFAAALERLQAELAAEKAKH
jgi:hypothetical protein